jgi:glycerol-3-phosphate acyltransferase PlsY
MDILINTALVIGAYLLGSVPQLSLLAKYRHVSLNGDYHMSLWQRAGKLIAIIGILSEFIKGAIPVLIGQILGINLMAVAIAGIAVVCGQCGRSFKGLMVKKGIPLE